jgi:ribosome maturation factor RimP
MERVFQVGVKDDVFALAEPVVAEQGLQLVEVEYVKEGPRWFVRVYIYQPDGVSLEDCKRVSDALSAVLDERDVVKTAYNLEVSSPGAERVLKSEREFKIFQGNLVKLTLREPVDKEQVLYGHLGPATAETLQLTDMQGQVRQLSRENIKQIRLALKSSVPAGK